MELKDIAPWIAIAITLALSILVPVFTQIANNNHQIKLQKEKNEYEQKQKKLIAYENFLMHVGAVIACPNAENFSLAGSSIQKIYLYAPPSWWNELDLLFDAIRNSKYGDATYILECLNREIYAEISKDNSSELVIKNKKRIKKNNK